MQNYLIGAYDEYIDIGVDGFRVDTAVHIRVTWNRRLLPASPTGSPRSSAPRGEELFRLGEVGAIVNDKWTAAP